MVTRYPSCLTILAYFDKLGFAISALHGHADDLAVAWSTLFLAWRALVDQSSRYNYLGGTTSAITPIPLLNRKPQAALYST